MVEEKLFPPKDRDQLLLRVNEIREQLAAVPAQLLASRTGVLFQETGAGRGKFSLEYWGKAVEISYPDYLMVELAGQVELNTFDQAMLAYYFRESDGTPQSGQWISFSELPDGHFYTQAFNGYTSGPMLKAFGDDIEAFADAAQQQNGRQPWTGAAIGDKSFVFPVLPQVYLLAVCWLGDEDFPTSYRVLFDSNISHHLTTDACAILGSALCRRLIKAREGGSRL